MLGVVAVLVFVGRARLQAGGVKLPSSKRGNLAEAERDPELSSSALPIYLLR